MSEKVCEECGSSPSKAPDGVPHLLDYCAVCSRDLCAGCMKKGCCGNVPALSENDDES